jgi:hypothetical protein
VVHETARGSTRPPAATGSTPAVGILAGCVIISRTAPSPTTAWPGTRRPRSPSSNAERTTDAAPSFIGSPALCSPGRSDRDSSDLPSPGPASRNCTLRRAVRLRCRAHRARTADAMDGPAHRVLWRASSSWKDGHRRPFACHRWPSRGVLDSTRNPVSRRNRVSTSYTSLRARQPTGLYLHRNTLHIVNARSVVQNRVSEVGGPRGRHERFQGATDCS